jgi:hypothetical protein
MMVARISLLLFISTSALAHGINGHIHVAAWAAAVVEGPTRALLEDAEVLDAFLFGAAFPDTGYAVDDGYGEIAHWEPFVEAFVQHLRREVPPPYDTLEKQKRVAFLMGVGAHGLQDEIFDTLFLPQIEARDGAGQDAADPGTDAFLHTGGHLEFTPAAYAPIEDVVQVLEESMGHTVAPGTVNAGMARVKAFVIDSIGAFAEDLDAAHRPAMPWGSRHYLDASIPGSLRSEVPATAAYAEALWQRLNGGLPVSGRVIHRYPGRDRAQAEDEPIPADSWVTLVFGVGVYVGTLSAETVRLRGPDGALIPCTISGQRWGRDPMSTSRLLVVKPDTAGQEVAQYTVELLPGIQFVDGERVEALWEVSLQAGDPSETAAGAGDAGFTPGPDGAAPTPAAERGGVPGGSGCMSQGDPGPSGPLGGLLAGIVLLGCRAFIGRRARHQAKLMPGTPEQNTRSIRNA